MQVSLSPSIQKYDVFQAQPSFGVNVLDSVMKNEKKADIFQTKAVVPEEKTLTEKEKTEIQARRIKSAVKRLIGVIFFADILYFAMKRSFKHSKIDKAAKKIEEAKKMVAPPVIIPKPFDMPL